MKSSRMVRASDCQCWSRNSPGFDPSILRHSGIWGAADDAVLNTVHREKNKKSPCLRFFADYFWSYIYIIFKVSSIKYLVLMDGIWIREAQKHMDLRIRIRNTG